MLTDAAWFVTDLGDQAVLLPLAVIVAVAFACLGWWRGAFGWTLAIGGTFAVMLVLKLGLLACGRTVLDGQIASPSGHTAASAAVYGGLLAMCGRALAGRGRWAAVHAAGAAAIAATLAAVIGLSRIGLSAHTVSETVLGGAVGTAGALAALVLTGPPPASLRVRYLLVVVAAAVAGLHGFHLQAETAVRQISLSLQAWLNCS